MGDPTLAKIVLRAQKGDESAFGEIIDHTQDRLFRFCVYLCGNPQLAQDISQDVYIKIIEKIKSVTDPDHFQTWMFSMARNLFIDHVRSPRNKEYTPVEELTKSLVIGGEDDKNFSMQVQYALGKLDPEERMVLLLVDLEGHSYDEAGKVMGVSEDAVRSRLHRARKEFVKRYKKGEAA